MTRPHDRQLTRALSEARLVLERAANGKVDSPHDRLQVARAYRVLGDSAQAASWYRSAVDALSAAGEAVKALAAAKEMSEVIPQERQTFASLADRFANSGGGKDYGTRVAVPLDAVAVPLARRGDEVVLDANELLKVHAAEEMGVLEASTDPGAGPLPSLVPPDVLHELHVRGEIELFDLDGRPVELEEEIGDDNIEIVEELEAADPEKVIYRLERVALFAALDRASFLELAQAVNLRTLGDRQYAFHEGEEATSFFLVAEGALELVRHDRKGKELALRHIHEGEAFGLFGLFAGKKRAASVRSIGHSAVLEIPAKALNEVVRKHPEAKRTLQAFYKERLLETFLASSPIFADLSAVARGLLIGQFREKHLVRGDKIVSPGEVFNGLYLVMSGEVHVQKRLGGGQEDKLAELTRGHFFGVVSALSGSPCRCTIQATEPTVLTYLPQRAFNEFVKDYPVLRMLPQRLAQEGLLADKDVFVGHLGIPGMS
jgi:CRP-like cAMP-binding protein